MTSCAESISGRSTRSTARAPSTVQTRDFWHGPGVPGRVPVRRQRGPARARPGRGAVDRSTASDVTLQDRDAAGDGEDRGPPWRLAGRPDVSLAEDHIRPWSGHRRRWRGSRPGRATAWGRRVYASVVPMQVDTAGRRASRASPGFRSGSGHPGQGGFDVFLDIGRLRRVARDRRPSRQTADVLGALAADPSAWRYGYELGLEVGLRSGSLYPILVRLSDRELLESRWEADAPAGRPPRHLYRLTASGLEYAAAHVRAAAAGAARPAPATGARECVIAALFVFAAVLLTVPAVARAGRARAGTPAATLRRGCSRSPSPGSRRATATGGGRCAPSSKRSAAGVRGGASASAAPVRRA